MKPLQVIVGPFPYRRHLEIQHQIGISTLKSAGEDIFCFVHAGVEFQNAPWKSKRI
jgi:hypothetical protein